MTIKLAFVQPNYQTGPTALNAYFLPYSVGVIWAYARHHIKIECTVTDWIFRRDPIVETARRLANNDIVAISCYIWNRNYNYKLASLIKQNNPNTLVVMGGPEPPITNKNMFKDFIPNVDIVIKQEGEKSFTEILNNFHTKNFRNIPGLLLNENLVPFDTGTSLRMNIEDMEYSPYTEGIFDDLMKKHPEIEWNSIFETNRGCPYNCTFCDWGGLTYSKVKKIELERVFSEIEWMGKNKIGSMAIADANFGMFVERDNLITDKILEVQEKYGFPYRVGTSWAKNQKHEVLAIAKKFMNGKFNNGLVVSVQSMDDHTLKTIKRNNLEINKISEIYKEANSIGLPVSTELIMPLPGETLSSWKKGIVNLLNLGQHNGVEVYQTQVLENTELNFQRQTHGVETIEAYGYMNNSTIDSIEEYPESVAVVKSTKDMPYEDVVKSYLFFWLINTFHVSGLTQLYARYLNKHDNVGYDEFYNKLETYFNTVPWYIDSKNIVESTYRKWLNDGQPTFIKIDEVGMNHLTMSFHTVMNLHNLENHEEVYFYIEKFIQDNFEIDNRIFADLKLLSRNYVTMRSKVREYPKLINLHTNMIRYLFNNAKKLIFKNYLAHVAYTEDLDLPKSIYLENLYFGRRRAFGKNNIKQMDDSNLIEFETKKIYTNTNV